MFDSLKSQKPQSKVMTSPCNPKPCALGAVRKTEDMRVQKEVEKYCLSSWRDDSFHQFTLYLFTELPLR